MSNAKNQQDANKPTLRQSYDHPDYVPPRPRRAITVLPGTKQKVSTLPRRFARGEQIFDDRDNTFERDTQRAREEWLREMEEDDQDHR